MRTFSGMNKAAKENCPICLTQNDGEVVLVGITGTQDDGIVEAAQFHLACIELMWDKNNGFLYQVLAATSKKADK